MTNANGKENLELLAREEKAGTHVMAARLALRKGEWDKARAALKDAFDLVPGEVHALEVLGDIYMAEGEQKKAIELFERALKKHPHHSAFEEKLAICHIDIAEMERDRVAREMILEGGDKDKILERQPAKAAAISLALPGAGQFYNDEPEKAYAFLAAALVSLVGWTWPLAAGLRAGQVAGEGDFPLGTALRHLNGFVVAVFWLMLLVWIGATIWSVFDATQSANRFNEARRRNLGL